MNLSASIKLFVLGVCVILGYISLSPLLYFKTGNLFFGTIPSLYNVNLAQFFFEQAADPVLQKPYPYAYHQLSRTYFIKGDLDTSLAFAHYELQIYPDHWGTYYIVGLTLGYLNHEQEAIDAFGKYIEHNPESWAARNDRAWLQFRVGDIDGALQTIGPVVKHIENPWIQNTYGTLLLNKERYEEARFAFENAKFIADRMTEESWGRAYPGNDPRIYGTGLQAMKTSITQNLEVLNAK